MKGKLKSIIKFSSIFIAILSVLSFLYIKEKNKIRSLVEHNRLQKIQKYIGDKNLEKVKVQNIETQKNRNKLKNIIKNNIIIGLPKLKEAHHQCIKGIEDELFDRDMADAPIVKKIPIIQRHRTLFSNRIRKHFDDYTHLFFVKNENEENAPKLPISFQLDLLRKVLPYTECYTEDLAKYYFKQKHISKKQKKLLRNGNHYFPTYSFYKDLIKFKEDRNTSYDQDKMEAFLTISKELESTVLISDKNEAHYLTTKDLYGKYQKSKMELINTQKFKNKPKRLKKSNVVKNEETKDIDNRPTYEIIKGYIDKMRQKYNSLTPKEREEVNHTIDLSLTLIQRSESEIKDHILNIDPFSEDYEIANDILIMKELINEAQLQVVEQLAFDLQRDRDQSASIITNFIFNERGKMGDRLQESSDRERTLTNSQEEQLEQILNELTQ